jgi:hypothetical protein
MRGTFASAKDIILSTILVSTRQSPGEGRSDFLITNNQSQGTPDGRESEVIRFSGQDPGAASQTNLSENLARI